MTNIGNEKSPNRVHRTIVPIVPVPPMKSTQTIEHQSLRGRNNKNFIVPPTVYYGKNCLLWKKLRNWGYPQLGNLECSGDGLESTQKRSGRSWTTPAN